MLSFDATPTLYWLLGYLLALGCIAAALRKQVPEVVFLLISLATFVFMRWPVVVLNRELNPDESQMISHAITLFYDPVYWRSVDGTTIGPLDIYWLVIPKLLGLPITYSTARVMGLLSNLAALVFFYQTLRLLFSAQVARFGVLLPLFFLAFTQETDWVHYSSEQVPLALMAACLYLCVRLWRSGGESGWQAFALGCVAGMVPFAKLQAVPQVLFLVGVGIYMAWSHGREKKQWQPLLSLLLGGVLFPSMVGLWAWYHGLLGDIWDFYIKGNVVYAGESSWLDIPMRLLEIVVLTPDFLVLAGAVVVLAVIGAVGFFQKKNTPLGLFPAFLAVGYLLLGIYAATKSGNQFVHYLHFILYPFALVGVWSLALLRTKSVGWLALVGLLGYFGLSDALAYYKTRQFNQHPSIGAQALHQSEVVQQLRQYTQSGDYMVVWGWQCRYYVEAQLPHGTAENHSERCIFEHPLQGTYRERYLLDLQRTRPVVVVDAVGKNSHWVQDKATQGIGAFPELERYIRENYHFKGEYDDARLYIRNDRY